MILNLDMSSIFQYRSKRRFKTVLGLARNVLKCYQPPNINILSKDILDLIQDQNIRIKFIWLRKVLIFFIVISRWWCHYFQNCTVEHIGFRGEKNPVDVLELFDCQVKSVHGGGKYGTFICSIFLDHINLILISQSQMLSCFMEIQIYSLVVNFLKFNVQIFQLCMELNAMYLYF